MKLGTITFLKMAVFITGTITLILCVFWLPWMAKNAAEMNPEYANLRYPVLIGLYLTAIPFFLAHFQFFKLLSYIKTENAFSELAVTTLNKIRHYAVTITLLYVIGFILLISQNALHPGIAIVGIAIVFTAFTISLFAAILQELLKSALELKSENDLTV